MAVILYIGMHKDNQIYLLSSLGKLLKFDNFALVSVYIMVLYYNGSDGAIALAPFIIYSLISLLDSGMVA